MVSIRRVTDTKNLHVVLEYLAIPKSRWKDMIEGFELASTRAVAYMHMILYAGPEVLIASQMVSYGVIVWTSYRSASHWQRVAAWGPEQFQRQLSVEPTLKEGGFGASG